MSCDSWTTRDFQELLGFLQEHPEYMMMWLPVECLRRVRPSILQESLSTSSDPVLGVILQPYGDNEGLNIPRILDGLKNIAVWDSQGTFRLSHLASFNLPWPMLVKYKDFAQVPLHQIFSIPLLKTMQSQGINFKSLLCEYAMRALDGNDEEAFVGILYWILSQAAREADGAEIVKALLQEAGVPSRLLQGSCSIERKLDYLEALVSLIPNGGSSLFRKLFHVLWPLPVQVSPESWKSGGCSAGTKPCSKTLGGTAGPSEKKTYFGTSDLSLLVKSIQDDPCKPPSVALLRLLLHLAIRQTDEKALYALHSLLRPLMSTVDDLTFISLLEANLAPDTVDPFRYCQELIANNANRLLSMDLRQANRHILGCFPSLEGRQSYFRRWERTPLPTEAVRLMHQHSPPKELSLRFYHDLDMLLGNFYCYPSHIYRVPTGKVLKDALWSMMLADVHRPYVSVSFLGKKKYLALTPRRVVNFHVVGTLEVLIGTIAYLTLHDESPIHLTASMRSKIACKKVESSDGALMMEVVQNPELVKLVRTAYNIVIC